MDYSITKKKNGKEEKWKLKIHKEIFLYKTETIDEKKMEIMKIFIKTETIVEIIENTRQMQDNTIFHIRQVLKREAAMQNAKRRGE